MTLTLDPATEARLQRELANGQYNEPSELLAHALDLIEAERTDLAVRRTQIIARLEESIAQGERGEVYTETQVRARMATLRAAHPEFA
jgi:Arc/MetJ-type ribon-helix-helix transcriptional regulator